MKLPANYPDPFTSPCRVIDREELDEIKKIIRSKLASGQWFLAVPENGKKKDLNHARTAGRFNNTTNINT